MKNTKSQTSHDHFYLHWFATTHRFSFWFQIVKTHIVQRTQAEHKRWTFLFFSFNQRNHCSFCIHLSNYVLQLLFEIQTLGLVWLLMIKPKSSWWWWWLVGWPVVGEGTNDVWFIFYWLSLLDLYNNIFGSGFNFGFSYMARDSNRTGFISGSRTVRTECDKVYIKSGYGHETVSLINLIICFTLHIICIEFVFCVHIQCQLFDRVYCITGFVNHISRMENNNNLVWQVNFATNQFATNKKSLQISRTGHYRICIGVFWLCAGNDRLDVLLIGDISIGIRGLLCGWPGLHTLDDHGRAIFSRTPAQCYGHSCFSQLDGKLCRRHRFSKFTGKYIDFSLSLSLSLCLWILTLDPEC